MHPVLLRHVAHDHVRTLIQAADAARLARAAAPSRRSSGLRRRLGLRLIAAGQRLATVEPSNVVHIHGGGA